MRNILALVLVLAFTFAIWFVGYQCGILHTVNDALIYLNDYEKPEDGKGDYLIYVRIDERVYEHGLYIF